MFQVKFGESTEIIELLSRLVDEQYILKTGVIKVRYVHPKFSKPWLVKSFHLLRHNRENMETFNSNSTYAISFINSDKKKRKVKTETTVDTSQSSSIVSEEIKGDEPLAKKTKPNEISSDNMDIDSVDVSKIDDGLSNESCSTVQNVESKRRHEDDSYSDDMLPNKLVKLSESFESVITEKTDEHFEKIKSSNSVAINGNVSSINSGLPVPNILPQTPESMTNLEKSSMESNSCIAATNENTTSPTSDPSLSNISSDSPELVFGLEPSSCSVETKENNESFSAADPSISNISSESSELISNLESDPCSVETKESSESFSGADPSISNISSDSSELVSNLESDSRIVETKENSESCSPTDPPTSNISSEPSELVSNLESDPCTVETKENGESCSPTDPPVSNMSSKSPELASNLESGVSSIFKSSQSSGEISNLEKAEERLEENSRVIMKATRKKWVSMSNENFSQLTKFDTS